MSERLNLWLKNAGHFLGSNLFVIYLWMLVMIVFFCREPGSRMGTDFRFMGTWGTTMQDHAWVIENIFLFLPFGFFPGLASEKENRMDDTGRIFMQCGYRVLPAPYGTGILPAG